MVKIETKKTAIFRRRSKRKKDLHFFAFTFPSLSSSLWKSQFSLSLFIFYFYFLLCLYSFSQCMLHWFSLTSSTSWVGFLDLIFFVFNIDHVLLVMELNCLFFYSIYVCYLWVFELICVLRILWLFSLVLFKKLVLYCFTGLILFG